MEDSRDGCHCSRCGDRSDGSSSREHAFSKPLMEDPDEQGEVWFNQGNLATERRSMLQLERGLEAALNFEHLDGEDSGPKVQPVWITCILLGCLFREWQVLGWAVKMYARFQCREFMRSLVKINDLEEQAEPPLSGEARALSSATFRGDAMDIEEHVGMRDEAPLA
jgi:DNA-binding XRE family transcriptional regulator